MAELHFDRQSRQRCQQEQSMHFSQIWLKKPSDLRVNYILASNQKFAQPLNIVADVVFQIKNMAYAYDAQLTVEERNMLSVAYKNITNSLRSSWRVIDSLETLESSRPKSRRLFLIRRQKAQIERELADTCRDILKVLSVV
jgi:14-3-3 protein epsilon